MNTNLKKKKKHNCAEWWHKDVKWEESEVNDTNAQEDANDTREPDKITRSRRVSRRPKQYENYEPF